MLLQKSYEKVMMAKICKINITKILGKSWEFLSPKLKINL